MLWGSDRRTQVLVASAWLLTSSFQHSAPHDARGLIGPVPCRLTLSFLLCQGNWFPPPLPLSSHGCRHKATRTTTGLVAVPTGPSMRLVLLKGSIWVLLLSSLSTTGTSLLSTSQTYDPLTFKLNMDNNRIYSHSALYISLGAVLACNPNLHQ